MDPSTETTLLLVLGLACVATLVLFPNKGSKDPRGVQEGESGTGSHRHGGVRQVLKQITLVVANSPQGGSKDWLQPF